MGDDNDAASDCSLFQAKVVPDCPICMSALAKELSATHCGHIFHTQCITSWKESKLGRGSGSTSAQCPMCRASITSKPLIKLAFTLDHGALNDFIHVKTQFMVNAAGVNKAKDGESAEDDSMTVPEADEDAPGDAVGCRGPSVSTLIGRLYQPFDDVIAIEDADEAEASDGRSCRKCADSARTNSFLTKQLTTLHQRWKQTEVLHTAEVEQAAAQVRDALHKVAHTEGIVEAHLQTIATLTEEIEALKTKAKDYKHRASDLNRKCTDLTAQKNLAAQQLSDLRTRAFLSESFMAHDIASMKQLAKGYVDNAEERGQEATDEEESLLTCLLGAQLRKVQELQLAKSKASTSLENRDAEIARLRTQLQEHQLVYDDLLSKYQLSHSRVEELKMAAKRAAALTKENVVLTEQLRSLGVTTTSTHPSSSLARANSSHSQQGEPATRPWRLPSSSSLENKTSSWNPFAVTGNKRARHEDPALPTPAPGPESYHDEDSDDEEVVLVPSTAHNAALHNGGVVALPGTGAKPGQKLATGPLAAAFALNRASMLLNSW